MASQYPSIAIIGGGVIGVSVGVHLLRQGARVNLFTEGELASGASGRSLSWLNSAGERSQAYHALRMAGIDRYRTLYAENPECDWLRFDGGLFWSEDDVSVRERHANEMAHAYHSRLTGGADVARHTPNVNTETLPDTAIFNPGEGWVSLPHLIDHLMQEFRELGGELGALGSGSHQRHVAAQHVPELRKLVQAGRTQPRHRRDDPHVVTFGEHGAAVLLRVGIHRAQLEHDERLAVATDSFLRVEDR